MERTFLRSWVVQLVKTLFTVYGNRTFITVFTRLRHWSVSWPRRIWLSVSL